MIEFGHYQELSWILERINGVRGAESGVKGTEPGTRDGRIRQTFVFSATLTLPRRSTEKKVKVRRRKNLSGQDSVGEVTHTHTPTPTHTHTHSLTNTHTHTPIHPHTLTLTHTHTLLLSQTTLSLRSVSETTQLLWMCPKTVVPWKHSLK